MPFIEQDSGSLEHARGGGHVPTVDRPGPGDAEMPGGTIAQRAGVCIDGAELRPVPE